MMKQKSFLEPWLDTQKSSLTRQYNGSGQCPDVAWLVFPHAVSYCTVEGAHLADILDGPATRMIHMRRK